MRKIRLVLPLIISFASSSCQNSSSSTPPSQPRNIIKEAAQETKNILETAKDKTKDFIDKKLEKPAGEALSDFRVVTEPINILGVINIKAPGTVRFEIKDDKNSESFISKTIQLGSVLTSKDNKEIFSSSSKNFTFEFKEKGAYETLITGTNKDGSLRTKSFKIVVF